MRRVAIVILFAVAAVATPHARCDDASRLRFCFEPDELREQLRDNAYMVGVHARYLEALGQRAISRHSKGQFIARVTVQTAFDGAAMVVVSEDADGDVIGHYYRTANKPRLPEKPLVLAQGEFAVSREWRTELNQTIAESNFWSEDNRQDVLMIDGSSWIVEVKDGARCRALYHPVPYGNAVYAVGKKLLDRAGIPLFDR